MKDAELGSMLLWWIFGKCEWAANGVSHVHWIASGIVLSRGQLKMQIM